MKKFNKFLILTVVVALVLSMSLVFVGCKKKPAPEPVPTTFVSMDVNPSVELVLDQNNVVMDVVCANQDAAIMLYEKDGIVGASVDVASKNIIDAAVELKYINNEDAKNVSISASSSDVAKVDAVVTETSASIKAELDLKGIQGKVEAGVDYMLQKELDTVKEHKAGIEGYANLELNKYRLVKRAMLANITLTMDEAVLMSEADLIKTIDYAKNEVKYAFDKVASAAIRVAQNIYEDAKAGVIKGVYAEVYARGVIPGGKKLLVNATAAYSSLPAKYFALATATYAVEETTNAIREIINNFALPVDDIKVILDNAGVDTTGIDKYTEKKNGKNVITKDSLVAYINKEYRNMTDEERAAFDGKYSTTVKVSMNEYEASANAAIDAKAGKFTAALDVPGLDITIKANMTIEDIDTIIAKLHKATDDKFDEMVANLTEDGKKAVEEDTAKVESKFNNAEEKLNNAIAKANADAEALIKQALDARKLELNIQVEVK